VSAPIRRADPDEASLVRDEWADAANRETRRVMGVWIGEPLPAYWPPYSAAAVERALAEARALLDDLMSDADSVSTDIERVQAIQRGEAET
jgi:hypothetical protein